MRLLVVDNHAASPHQQALYRALAARDGFEVTLLVPRHWHDGFTEQSCHPESLPGLRLISANAAFSGRSHRGFMPHLWTLLRRERFDILLLDAEPETFQALHGSLLRSLSAATSRLVVTSWRNIGQAPGVYPYRLSWLHHYAERNVLSRIDGLIAHNRTAQSILEKKTRAVIETIPPCVDSELFKGHPPSEEAVRENGSRFAIGYAGRLVVEKGVDTLLSACSRMDHPRELHIYGRGPDEQRLRKLALTLGMGDDVIWHGGVALRDLPGHLAALDVLVLPSRTTEFWKEQFGRVLTEAMAAGVPVVGSDSGEIPETIGPAGLVFPEGDAGSLHDQLLRIRSDRELRRRLIEAGELRVKEKFSSHVVSGAYAAFFRRISEAK